MGDAPGGLAADATGVCSPPAAAAAAAEARCDCCGGVCCTTTGVACCCCDGCCCDGDGVGCRTIDSDGRRPLTAPGPPPSFSSTAGRCTESTCTSGCGVDVLCARRDGVCSSFSKKNSPSLISVVSSVLRCLCEWLSAEPAA